MGPLLMGLFSQYGGILLGVLGGFIGLFLVRRSGQKAQQAKDESAEYSRAASGYTTRAQIDQQVQQNVPTIIAQAASTTGNANVQEAIQPTPGVAYSDPTRDSVRDEWSRD